MSDRTLDRVFELSEENKKLKEILKDIYDTGYSFNHHDLIKQLLIEGDEL